MVRICKLFADSPVKDLVESSSAWGGYGGDKKEMLYPGNLILKREVFCFNKKIIYPIIPILSISFR